ncbi:MAG TPA: T9SS type A sorting domain-containing protein [Chitinophagaceae bacterium]|nr:T9SS type A sorting domain-containing protein [Chitinophagaceae bacterium]
MKKIALFLCLFIIAVLSRAQTVSDNFNWLPSTAVTTATSPQFAFCNRQTISYTVVAVNSDNFFRSSSWDGLYITHTSSSATTIPMRIIFSKPVCNLRLRIVDIDGGNETITNIAPAYSTLTDVAGDFFDPTGTGVSIGATGNNSSGWVQWNGTVTQIDFTYRRPVAGWAIILDSIMFDCCTPPPPPPCKRCNYEAVIRNPGTVSEHGNATSEVWLSSGGVPVRSICMNLPFYVSNVKDDCLKCDVAQQESFGTILSAGAIAGTNATFYDPMGLGYSRKVCWNFPALTVVDELVSLNLKFPPVLPLSCCKNAVDYCLDAIFTNEDCTSCGYTVCTRNFQVAEPYNPDSKNAKTSKKTEVFYNDFAESKGFQLVPNPAGQQVEVTLLDQSLIGGTISVRTVEGKNVLSVPVSQAKQVLQLAQLMSGIYLVTIENNGQVVSEKLVIR